MLICQFFTPRRFPLFRAPGWKVVFVSADGEVNKPPESWAIRSDHIYWVVSAG